MRLRPYALALLVAVLTAPQGLALAQDGMLHNDVRAVILLNKVKGGHQSLSKIAPVGPGSQSAKLRGNRNSDAAAHQHMGTAGGVSIGNNYGNHVHGRSSHHKSVIVIDGHVINTTR